MQRTHRPRIQIAPDFSHGRLAGPVVYPALNVSPVSSQIASMPSDLSPQRMSIEQFNNQVRVRIPGARHKEHTLLLSIQSVALALSGPVVCCLATQVMLSLLETNDAASLVFGLACVGGLLLGWPVAAVSLVYSLLWETRGVETLTLSSDGITRELTPAPLFRGRRGIMLRTGYAA